MKNLKLYILILMLSLAITSCEKFLDIPRLNTQVPISTATDCQALLDKYSQFNQGYPSQGEISADDYYIRDVDYTSASTLGQNDRNLYTWNAVAAGTSWIGSYKAVNVANMVLEVADKIKGETDVMVFNNIRGSALFYRSFTFWYIAQQYAKPYSTTANQDLGIPLRLTSDINEISDRGTVQKTYDKIVADLKEAADLLPTTQIIASRPSKAAAFAMLARVYLSMEDYGNALINASSALEINHTLLDYNSTNVNKTSNTPFIRFNAGVTANPEVIFQSTLDNAAILRPNVDNNNMAKMDATFVNSYDDNDWRKTVFFKPNSAVHVGTFRFTGSYEPTTDASFFCGLAVDELYLTRAECYARMGNASAAMTDLNTLLAKRWKNTVTYPIMTASSTDDALAKILMERRKELIMRGQRWTDLRRLNKDSRFAKTLTRIVNGITYTLPPNDLRYTLLIPNDVIAGASTIQQNTR